MTLPSLAAVPSPDLPQPDTLVLLHRKLNPARTSERSSVFADDRWDLSPGLFEAHVPTVRLNFLAIPDRFRDTAKQYIWRVINHDHAHPRRGSPARLALRTVAYAMPYITTFFHWLDTRGISRILDVTATDLDQYAADVADTEASISVKGAMLVEVRRLWSYRSLLPEPIRLPMAPPWGGDDPAELLGGATRQRENRTHRIASDTMEPLLMWCLRIAKDFSDDIIAAYHEHLRLWKRSPANRSRKHIYGGNYGTVKAAEAPLRAHLNRLKQTNTPLPGRTLPDGTRDTDWAHLCRLFDLVDHAFRPGQRLRRLVEESGLPTGEGAYLDVPIAGRLGDEPWRDTAIGYAEAPRLADLLRTTCLVIIAYLTGMRTGEILNLERGCVNHDPVTGLWLVTGRKWKDARDHHGDKIPEGQQRDDPWTTVSQVTEAIAVLERLHGRQLLFPAHLHPARLRATRSGAKPSQGLLAGQVSPRVSDLITWINQVCEVHDLGSQRIPPDPHGRVTVARFRRTLAWHIVRRPRGLIAGAIQYGHLYTQITLGYAGTYDSGFPDEHAYEDWLFRIDNLAEDHGRLTGGEHVSGPAADAYRHRVEQAHQRFAGRVLPSVQQARDMLANPLLQIYPGRAMTCVFDPAKALCQLRTVEDDLRRTPDQDDCRPTCQNIAYTDGNIADVRRRADELRDHTDDRLAPSIRHQRERAELDRLRTIIRRHDHGK